MPSSTILSSTLSRKIGIIVGAILAVAIILLAFIVLWPLYQKWRGRHGFFDYSLTARPYPVTFFWLNSARSTELQRMSPARAERVKVNLYPTSYLSSADRATRRRGAHAAHVEDEAAAAPLPSRRPAVSHSTRGEVMTIGPRMPERVVLFGDAPPQYNELL